MSSSQPWIHRFFSACSSMLVVTTAMKLRSDDGQSEEPLSALMETLVTESRRTQPQEKLWPRNARSLTTESGESALLGEESFHGCAVYREKWHALPPLCKALCCTVLDCRESFVNVSRGVARASYREAVAEGLQVFVCPLCEALTLFP